MAKTLWLTVAATLLVVMFAGCAGLQETGSEATTGAGEELLADAQTREGEAAMIEENTSGISEESQAHGREAIVGQEESSSVIDHAELDSAWPATKANSNPELRRLSGKQIAITVGGTSIVVDLYDNSAANDLLTKLPLSFEVSDYSWPEKLLYLDRADELSMDDYTGGDEPWIPELGYYEPGNWIALYYGYIGYWPGKIPLGRIEATCAELEALPAGELATVSAL